MTPEERQLLQDLFDRLRQATHDDMDREADRFIADRVRAQPYAPYFMAQALIVQEQTIGEAAQRIEELEQRVRDLEDELDRGRPRTSGSGSFLGGARRPLGSPMPPRDVEPEAPRWGRGTTVPSTGSDGGGAGGPWQRQPEPPPMPSAPPMPQAPQQPQASRGGGFLKGALATAAGVAGGAILFDQLKGMLGGNQNNPFGDSAGAQPDASSDVAQADTGWDSDSGGDDGIET